MNNKSNKASCEKHLIVWDWKNPVFPDDEMTLTIEGMCDRCCRRFQATYTDPKYSVMDLDKKGNDVGEWHNYELLGSEVFAN